MLILLILSSTITSTSGTILVLAMNTASLNLYLCGRHWQHFDVLEMFKHVLVTTIPIEALRTNLLVVIVSQYICSIAL